MNNTLLKKTIYVCLFAAIVITFIWFQYDIWHRENIFKSLSAWITSIIALLVFHQRVTSEKVSNPPQHDLDLYKQFLTEFPADPTLSLLRDSDFGNSFRRASIQPLFDFAETWNKVDKEFIDGILEMERKTFYEVANDFSWEVVKRTVPIGDFSNLSVVSDNQRASGNPRPPHIIEDARVLNEKARNVAAAYERFVRRCREKLSK